MKLKAIITGATGMVGEGVVHECLQRPEVESVLIINRKPSGINHPKLTEIVHGDFFDICRLTDQLRNYNACFFCLGVSAIGMTEKDYSRITYDLTLNVARTLADLNPEMTFCYVSGAGTDSSAKGRSMWARVKGKTENDLMKLPFKSVYAFRPGFMRPTAGLNNALKFYKYIDWLFPVLRKAFPKHVSTLAEVGQAMINAALKNPPKKILEVPDIVRLAKT